MTEPKDGEHEHSRTPRPLVEEALLALAQGVGALVVKRVQVLGFDDLELGYIEMLQQGHADGDLENKFEWGGDFGAPDETYLSNQFGQPVFVHRFPAEIKGFYFERDPDRPELALGIDLLAPEGYGEIIGGGERASDLGFLEKQLEEHDLPREAFEWYLDLRRYGSVPHAGFGMGIERCVSWMCGIEHIRQTIPFPRMLYRLAP